MKDLSTKLFVALLGLALIVPSVSSGAEFVTFGFAMYTPAVDQVGATVTVYGIITDTGGIDEPLVLDFDNFEYTICVNGWVIVDVNDPLPTLRQVTLDGGTVRLFEDPIVGGTAADYANVGTFVDGDMFLEVAFQDGHVMTLFDSDDTDVYSGSGAGLGDLVGGSRIGEIASPLTDWQVVSVLVADEGAIPGLVVPDGYDRVLDMKIVAPPVVASESTAWGAVKNLYR